MAAAVQTTLFIHKATIQRRTASGTDPAGHPTYGAWANSSTDVASRYDERGESSRAGLMQYNVLRPMLFFPIGTDVKMNDRITDIKRADDTVISPGPFGILGIADPAGEGHHLQVTIEKA
tara:strand:+ start:346 stop:705 length:360 start_codon:yes stop_codon:yes gene_type:complete